MSNLPSAATGPTSPVEGVLFLPSTSDEAQHGVPPSLPSQSPSQPINDVPSPPNSDRSRPQWPSGFTLFFDPTSERAVRLGQELSTQHPSITPLVTLSMDAATHVILDSSSTFGDALSLLLPSPRIQHVVTLEWIYQSILNATWEPEAGYLFKPSVGGKQLDGEIKEDSNRQTVELDGGNPVLEERWPAPEDEDLARFLSSLDDLSALDETGQDVLDRYVKETSTQRTADECRKHHQLRRDAFFDYRVLQLREEAVTLAARSAASEMKDTKGKGKEREGVVSQSAEPENIGRRTRARVAAVEKPALEKAVESKGKGKGKHVDVKPSKPPAIGPWTQSENDSLALFLSSSDPDHYTTKDENGLDMFDSFSTTKNTRRSDTACRSHYKKFRTTIDDLVAKLKTEGTSHEDGKEGNEVETSPDAAATNVGRKKRGTVGDEALPSESSEDDSDFEDDSDDYERERRTTKKPGRGHWYPARENADLRRFLRESKTVTEASKKFSAVYPHRKASTIRSYVSANKKHFADDRSAHQPAGRPRQADRAEKSEERGNSQIAGRANVEKPVSVAPRDPKLVASSYPPPTSFSQAYSNSFPRSSSTDVPQPFLAVASSSTVTTNSMQLDRTSPSISSSSTRNLDPASHSAASPSVASNVSQHSEARPSSSYVPSTTRRRDADVPKPSEDESEMQRKRPRSENPQRNEGTSVFMVASSSKPPISLRPPAPLLSSHHQQNRPINHHYPPAFVPPQVMPYQASFSPTSNPPASPREPPSFLLLGTTPSSYTPPSPFCWFCGNDKGPTYSAFHLAAPSSPSGALVRIEAKLVCSGCSGWFERSLRGGGEFVRGVSGMGELEKLSWVRDKLSERGVWERSRSVVGAPV
ncbi:hypothetical protein BDY24DRAFT_443330 [Mrakia frigida]|uniref:uncharacterized protein n=1 Tax=Mrakia frigida TaxID=29902 RepID=UPI003FCC0465